MTRRVIIVDDNEQILRLMRRMLSGLDVDVETFTRPADALSSCEASGPPDLLISDVHMPGMPGPELHRALCEAHGVLPVLYVSADPATGYRAEVDRLLEKPFSREQLVDAVRSLLDDV